MIDEIRLRLRWVKLYLSTGDAGLVCRRCGISRPTLRKWIRRYQREGEAGLANRSRRPRRSPQRKLFQKQRTLILRFRREQNMGARRIQSELRLYQGIELSLATIHKVLTQANVKWLIRPRRPAVPKRYSRPVPGDRIQLDTMKIAPGVYQYTAIDDCSRFRVLGLYPRRTAKYTVDFMERVVEEMPFPIQRVQSDRGGEFFAERVQRWLMDQCIKFRPIPPRSPHLNGKVERSQLTDLQEFWPRVSPKHATAQQRIQEWQFDYNWRRAHGSLKSKTPIDRICELEAMTPTWEKVSEAFDASRERIRHRDWSIDQRLARLARNKITEEELPTASRVRVREKRRTRAARDNSPKK